MLLAMHPIPAGMMVRRLPERMGSDRPCGLDAWLVLRHINTCLSKGCGSTISRLSGYRRIPVRLRLAWQILRRVILIGLAPRLFIQGPWFHTRHLRDSAFSSIINTDSGDHEHPYGPARSKIMSPIDGSPSLAWRRRSWGGRLARVRVVDPHHPLFGRGIDRASASAIAWPP
jgi:hypothetical protein